MSFSLQLPTRKRQTLKWGSKRGREKNYTSKPISEEFAKFNNLISNYETENSFIKETIAAFNELNTNKSAGDFLLSQFDLELQELTKRINSRFEKIDSIIAKSKIKKQRTLNVIDGSCEKSKAIEENKFLINQVMELEQQNVLAHIKIRAWHDHRDLCKLKLDVENFDSGEQTETEKEILKNKLIIRNLKKYIQHEKTRAIQKLIKQTPEDEAATKIQSTWRMFKGKQEMKEAKADMKRTNSEISTKSEASQQFSELGESQKERENI